MKFAMLLIVAFSLTMIAPVVAQNQRGGVQSFQQSNDAWRRNGTGNQSPVISQNIVDALGNSATTNIAEAEAVFCYQIASKPAGYKGYTIDNMAVTGFCGIVEDNLKNMIVQQFLAISSPCHSFSLFYGGKLKTYNFSPAAEIIDVMVESFRSKTVPFVSPAMLKQLLPIGVAQTQAQKDIVAKQSGPIRNWDTQKDAPKKTEPKKSGWNNLKL